MKSILQSKHSMENVSNKSVIIAPTIKFSIGKMKILFIHPHYPPGFTKLQSRCSKLSMKAHNFMFFHYELIAFYFLSKYSIK